MLTRFSVPSFVFESKGLALGHFGGLSALRWPDSAVRQKRVAPAPVTELESAEKPAAAVHAHTHTILT
jgi:hypothetical protein